MIVKFKFYTMSFPIPRHLNILLKTKISNKTIMSLEGPRYNYHDPMYVKTQHDYKKEPKITEPNCINKLIILVSHHLLQLA